VRFISIATSLSGSETLKAPPGDSQPTSNAIAAVHAMQRHFANKTGLIGINRRT
jgi:hypothetical protein